MLTMPPKLKAFTDAVRAAVPEYVWLDDMSGAVFAEVRGDREVWVWESPDDQVLEVNLEDGDGERIGDPVRFPGMDPMTTDNADLARVAEAVRGFAARC